MDPLCLFILFCIQLQTITTKQKEILKEHPHHYEEELRFFFPAYSLSSGELQIILQLSPVCQLEITAVTTHIHQTFSSFPRCKCVIEYSYAV